VNAVSEIPLTAELVTIRDWLRFAVSKFLAAKLSFGHGASTALDEAAYLILHTLHLPIDQMEPWLDARLTKAERTQVAAIIEKRVVTRKPAAYLTQQAWIGPHAFYVDERVIVPRSYIGELLHGDAAGLVGDAGAVRRVLDLCTGSGCLAILAALAFDDAQVDAVDISDDALAVARQNIEAYGLSDRVTPLHSDVFADLGDRRYDLIIANPPYVTEAAVAAFPAEYKAEPVLAHVAGPDGLSITRRIMAEAAKHLEPDGTLIVEIGHGRAAVEAEWPNLPFLWLDTEESSGEVFSLPASVLGNAKPARARKAKR
jgi:ribosomal protein L3 glutamine methyltransferase